MLLIAKFCRFLWISIKQNSFQVKVEKLHSIKFIIFKSNHFQPFCGNSFNSITINFFGPWGKKIFQPLFRSPLLEKVFCRSALLRDWNRWQSEGTRLVLYSGWKSISQSSTSSFGRVMSCDVGSSVVVEEADGTVVQTVELNLTDQTVQLLAL